MTVTDPGGVQWQVRRRWSPWRRRLGLDGVDVGADDNDILGWLAPVIWLLEITALLIAAPLVWLWRALGRSPWPVEVERAGNLVRTYPVVGFAAAARRRDELAAAIAAGRTHQLIGKADQWDF